MRGKVTIGAGKHYVNNHPGLSRPSTSFSSTSPLPGPTSTYLLRIWWLRSDRSVSCARKSGRVMVMVGALSRHSGTHLDADAESSAEARLRKYYRKGPDAPIARPRVSRLRFPAPDAERCAPRRAVVVECGCRIAGHRATSAREGAGQRRAEDGLRMNEWRWDGVHQFVQYMLQVLSAIKSSSKRSTSSIAPRFPLFYNLPFIHSHPARCLPRSHTPKMVYTHGTPYVTPHILHKHYAQAHDAEVSNLIGRDLEYFSQAGFDMDRIQIKRNAPPAVLYEDAIRNEGAIVSSSGALINFSGKKTGRSPKDKRIVYEDTSKDEIWWGSVNIKMDEHTFEINRERAIDYLNTRENVYVFDGYAGWDPKYRIKVRVICARAYHALFMNNMLIRPTEEELANFGEPDFIIYNAGQFPANRFTKGMSSTTSVEINFKRMEMVILGTEYAGEMKKGVFSVMHYLQPVKFGTLSLHSSANVGETGDVTLFFGLSGTGKTTLSADPRRKLIGDDEHVWSDTGVFNIEGGCYAKCINLSAEKEPEIFGAIRFGSVLENVVYNPISRVPDYDDASITENTRCAYPIEYIPNAQIPCHVASQPKNIIMLTCDAFGVLPPVAKLSPEQASYHFLAGYTSKTPGTEDGVLEPIPTFSTCYSAPFIVLHPGRYAEMLAERMSANNVDCWLINTGWTGGRFGSGKRCPLKYTRRIVDAVHSGELAKAEYETFGVFGLQIPTALEGVPRELLNPRLAWTNKEAFEREVRKLAGMFQKAFALYESDVDEKVRLAGPQTA